MAVTGSILVLFVAGHLAGNLQVFLGEEALNHYAELLRIEPPLLWAIRVVLLVTAVIHVITGVSLWAENRAARPERYAKQRSVQATIASRTMIYSGIIVMGFIIYHLLHLTFRTVGPAGYTASAHNVYRNVVAGFSDPVITILYIVGQLLLYFHLSHGIASLFQSLGFRQPRYDAGFRRASAVIAFLIAAGNISMPLAVLVGLVK